jgi:hypothetical protein
MSCARWLNGASWRAKGGYFGATDLRPQHATLRSSGLGHSLLCYGRCIGSAAAASALATVTYAWQSRPLRWMNLALDTAFECSEQYQVLRLTLQARQAKIDVKVPR